ncbi:hypothetical protein ACQP0C_41775 (plasmid) [Nocardia sp. CA-129566]|uniref:hypothetical protein n=1 Tax=Nocardia sp. CA-129566 TaxID=3239976 RepID=UPI003D97C554
MTTENTAPEQELRVDKALRQAYESLTTAATLATTSNGERASRVIGAQFDAAFAAVETLLELRAGDRACTTARFGATGMSNAEIHSETVRLAADVVMLAEHDGELHVGPVQNATARAADGPAQ